jgi:ankyrin repeat protein
VEILLEHNANPNAQNDKGLSPLLYALRCQR